MVSSWDQSNVSTVRTFGKRKMFVERLHHFIPYLAELGNNVASDTRANRDFMMRMNINRAESKLGL
jgi:hypothetical protein